MRLVLSVPLAVLLAVGAASTAGATPWVGEFDALGAHTPDISYAGPHPHDHCHGRASGTSEATCGRTMSGGPSGGLF